MIALDLGRRSSGASRWVVNRRPMVDGAADKAACGQDRAIGKQSECGLVERHIQATSERPCASGRVIKLRRPAVASNDQDFASLEQNSCMETARLVHTAGDRPGFSRGVIQLRVRPIVRAAHTAGSEHPAVSQQGSRDIATRKIERARNGPLVGRRVVEFALAHYFMGIVTSSHQHFAAGQQSGGKLELLIYDTPRMTLVFLAFDVAVLAAQV